MPAAGWMRDSLIHRFAEPSHITMALANQAVRERGWPLRAGTARGPPVCSAAGLSGLGADGFDLIHNLHGVFARQAVGLEDRLDVGVNGIHLGGQIGRASCRERV